MQIQFFLPDFYANFQLIIFLADLMKQSPEYFYDDVKIAAAYGCFPGSIWNGGRVIHGSCTKQEMQLMITELNARDIAVRYTFTNPLLESRHILDTFCNLCLELSCNGKNEVIVNSPLLEDYIRRAFPGKFKMISSTTKCINNISQIREELQKDYAYVVLDSAMNNTDELFTLEPKEKIELIANHYCMDNCPRRKEHYEVVGQSQLEFSEIEFPACSNINRDFYQIMKNRSFISTDLIFGKYKDAGFRNYKLDGRAFHVSKVLESFLYYLIRPELRDRVRTVVLRELYKL